MQPVEVLSHSGPASKSVGCKVKELEAAAATLGQQSGEQTQLGG